MIIILYRNCVYPLDLSKGGMVYFNINAYHGRSGMLHTKLFLFLVLWKLSQLSIRCIIKTNASFLSIRSFLIVSSRNIRAAVTYDVSLTLYQVTSANVTAHVTLSRDGEEYGRGMASFTTPGTRKIPVWVRPTFLFFLASLFSTCCFSVFLLHFLPG